MSRCAYCEAPARHGSPLIGVWVCAEHRGDCASTLAEAVRLASAWSKRQQHRRLALEAARAQHRRELARAGDALEAEAS